MIKAGGNCIVLREGKILLGKRINKFGHDTWQIPGGHLEEGELAVDGAKRELFEEAGIVPTKMEFLSVVNQPVEILTIFKSTF